MKENFCHLSCRFMVCHCERSAAISQATYRYAFAVLPCPVGGTYSNVSAVGIAGCSRYVPRHGYGTYRGGGAIRIADKLLYDKVLSDCPENLVRTLISLKPQNRFYRHSRMRVGKSLFYIFEVIELYKFIYR